MQTEIEATFLDVNPDEIRQRLKKIDAKLVQPETLMRRIVLDYPDMRLDEKHAWLRVRDEGHRVTATYKERQSETIHGMKEVEVVVSSFEETWKLLEAIGLVKKAYQETKREIWRLDDCEVTIDTWPWIPPFVEVEGHSEGSVKSVSEKLGFTWADAVFDSADANYQRFFDVKRREISSIDIVFGPVPDELEAKRIHK